MCATRLRHRTAFRTDRDHREQQLRVRGSEHVARLPDNLIRKRRGFGVVLLILGIAYPCLVFVGLRWFTVREIAIGVAILILLRLLTSARHGLGGLRLFATFAIAFGGPVGIALALESEFALRLVPAMINGAMLVVFATTLRTTPMIERFARLHTPTLSPEQQRHCRQFTIAWCAYFAINGAIALALCFGPRGWWALHTGVLSYVGMGVLFATEFVVRRVRFREFSSAFYDRALLRILPPEER